MSERLTSRPFFTCAALIASMLLGACGFQPLHSQAYRESQPLQLASVALEVSGTDLTPSAVGDTVAVPRRYTELLKAEIEDQVNPTGVRAEKLFKLAISYSEQQVGLFVNPDGTASRGDLVYSSSYTITRLADAKVITSGTISRTSSFNTSPTADYASYVSIEDARKRGIIELGQDYKLRLAALMPMINDPNSVLNNPPKTDTTNDKPLPVLQPVNSYETHRPGY